MPARRFGFNLASLDLPRRRASFYAGAVISGATFLAYANSLDGPFIFDDIPSIVANASIRDLGSAWRPPNEHGVTVSGRPIVNLTLAANYAAGGLGVWGYHAFNVLVHALAGLLLFGVVRRTLTSSPLRGSFGACSFELALFSAAVWCLHPLQTAAVTYVIQRAESLVGLFYLLTLWCFTRSVQGGHRFAWQGGAIAACFAGMATKEVMVSAPLIIALYDRVFLAPTWREVWSKRGTFHLGLASGWVVLLLLVLSTSGRGGTAGLATPIAPFTYLFSQGKTVLHYLQLAAWPSPLVFDYGRSLVHEWRVLLMPTALVLVLALGSGWAAVRARPSGFCGVFFFALLAPSSSLVPIATQTAAEHRMYLALAAPVCLAACGAYYLFGPRARWLLGPLALVFGLMTAMRNYDYRDTHAIWADTVAKHPANPRAQNNLAIALGQSGKASEANEHFSRAIELDPTYVQAYSNWGAALLAQNLPEAALGKLSAAVSLAPGYADAQLNLGNALVKTNREAEAVMHYEAAAKLKPAADVYYNLGVTLSGLGRDQDASKNLQMALAENSQLPEAHYQLGRLAEKGNQARVAIAEYEAALRLAPGHVASHRHLGLLRAQENRLDAAELHFRAVIQSEADDPDAYANLGNVLLIQGRLIESISNYEKALQLRPGDPLVLENLSLARASANAPRK